MADIVSREKRSEMMSGIRGKDTRPEMQIRRRLHADGFRFRLHTANLPGKPDLVLPKYHAVIFVNGCFWHGHNCHLFKVPSTRSEFWKSKIEGNRSRDENVRKLLLEQSWRVLTVWECALKGRSRLEFADIMDDIETWLKSDAPILELRGES